MLLQATAEAMILVDDASGMTPTLIWMVKRSTLQSKESVQRSHAAGTTKASKPGTFVGQCNGAAQSANFIEREDKNGNQHVFGSIVVGEEICHMTEKRRYACESASSYPEEEEMDAPPLEDGERDLAAVGQNLRGSIVLILAADVAFTMILEATLTLWLFGPRMPSVRQSGLNPGCSLNDDTETRNARSY